MPRKRYEACSSVDDNVPLTNYEDPWNPQLACHYRNKTQHYQMPNIHPLIPEYNYNKIISTRFILCKNSTHSSSYSALSIGCSKTQGKHS